ncbi:Uncharacterised protein [Yersinia frederiksenii]|nr:Uncharacterised protein [Yersinia frederiksenii]CNJ01138.1 Uncharacterised protein [Yersinia frederiksenii]
MGHLRGGVVSFSAENSYFLRASALRALALINPLYWVNRIT